MVYARMPVWGRWGWARSVLKNAKSRKEKKHPLAKESTETMGRSSLGGGEDLRLGDLPILYKLGNLLPVSGERVRLSRQRRPGFDLSGKWVRIVPFAKLPIAPSRAVPLRRPPPLGTVRAICTAHGSCRSRTSGRLQIPEMDLLMAIQV